LSTRHIAGSGDAGLGTGDGISKWHKEDFREHMNSRPVPERPNRTIYAGCAWIGSSCVAYV
jgi:hypothetical protein